MLKIGHCSNPDCHKKYVWKQDQFNRRVAVNSKEFVIKRNNNTIIRASVCDKCYENLTDDMVKKIHDDIKELVIHENEEDAAVSGKVIAQMKIKLLKVEPTAWGKNVDSLPNLDIAKPSLNLKGKV